MLISEQQSIGLSKNKVLLSIHWTNSNTINLARISDIPYIPVISHISPLQCLGFILLVISYDFMCIYNIIYVPKDSKCPFIFAFQEKGDFAW